MRELRGDRVNAEIPAGVPFHAVRFADAVYRAPYRGKQLRVRVNAFSPAVVL